MTDKKNSFLTVTERLRMAIDVSSDVLLAERLGLKYSAWSMRKTRGTLPTQEIDALIEREDLNPEFIYKGTGPVHVPLDGVAWGQQFQTTLTAVLSPSDVGWLVREGHPKPMLTAVAAGKQPPSMALLRDLRKVLTVDLNALFCDEPTTALDSAEKALIDAYRSAPTEGKATIQQVAGMAAKKAPEPKAAPVKAAKPRVKKA